MPDKHCDSPKEKKAEKKIFHVVLFVSVHFLDKRNSLVLNSCAPIFSKSLIHSEPFLRSGLPCVEDVENMYFIYLGD